MRMWLTKEQMDKLPSLSSVFINGFEIMPHHVHYVYTSVHGTNSVEYDFIIKYGSDTSYTSLHINPVSEWHYDNQKSYKSLTLEQILNILPTKIYCDDEYNKVNISEVKNYRTLKLHIIKQENENNDINYMYKVIYKPINNPCVRKRIHIKKYEYKDPELESDELIDILFDMLLWCINHDFIIITDQTTKKKISRGH